MADSQPNLFEHDSQTEEWRPVVGYEGIYSVSSLGRVRVELKRPGSNKKPGDLLTQNEHQPGRYLCVGLTVNDKKRTKMVAHLVAQAFIGERPEGYQVNHLDGNILNNRVDNLEYCSRADNMAHATKYGFRAKGERVGASKLNPEKVREIKRLVRAGYKSQEIGPKFGVTGACIRGIISGKAWRYIE